MLHEIPAPETSLPLRLPQVPLPAYRYVPGLHPHPHKHEGGHRHAPVLEGEALWLHGLDLFDQRYYWECHEVLEGRWKTLPLGSTERELYQGLIQAAAAVLQAHMGRMEGAARLLQRAERRLETVEARIGPIAPAGVDLPRLRVRLRAFLAGGPWPLINP